MAEMKTVVVGDILIQDNQERKFGADPQYAVVWVTSGKEQYPLVFTKEDIYEAELRAKFNREDVPDLGSEAAINEWDAE